SGNTTQTFAKGVGIGVEVCKRLTYREAQNYFRVRIDVQEPVGFRTENRIFLRTGIFTTVLSLVHQRRIVGQNGIRRSDYGIPVTGPECHAGIQKVSYSQVNLRTIRREALSQSLQQMNSPAQVVFDERKGFGRS